MCLQYVYSYDNKYVLIETNVPLCNYVIKIIKRIGRLTPKGSLLEGESKHTIAVEIIMMYMWIRMGGFSRV